MATQHQLIKEYCRRFGKIVPAKLKEADRAAIPGGFIGSECIRRCQELVERGEMYRWPSEGKFAVYSVVPAPTPVLVANLAPRTDVHRERKDTPQAITGGVNNHSLNNCPSYQKFKVHCLFCRSRQVTYKQMENALF